MKNESWEMLESRCHTPYSGKTDTCFVKGDSGILYPGIRVENVSFPLTVDAVQSAVFSCLSEGDSPRTLILPESCSSQILRYWCETYNLQCLVREQPMQEHGEEVFLTSETLTNIDRLKELAERCVIPYSSFPVTALLRADNGIFSGVNIETADWQKGLCAERVAIAKARASGARSFPEIHVYAPQSDYVSPCGACRQVLMEHMEDGVMYLHHNDTECSRLRVSDLLPYQFKASNLGHRL